MSTGIVKKLLNTTQNEKKNHNEIVMLARSKVNSIESKIREALLNKKISHEDFTTIINEEKNYHKLEVSIRMMKTQRSNTEKIIEEDKRKDIDKIIRQNDKKL